MKKSRDWKLTDIELDFKELLQNSDTLIANLKGKNKSFISKAREKYVKLIRALCDYYGEDEY